MIRRVLVVACLALCFASTARAEEVRLTAEERHNVTMRVLEGNWEFLAGHDIEGLAAEDAFPFAVRDLWWRPDPAASRYDRFTERDDLWGARYRWLFDPRGPYPMPEMGELDPWPELSAVIQDRVRREAEGPSGLPGNSPITPLVQMLDTLDAGPGLDAEGRHRLWYLGKSLDHLSIVVDGYAPTAADLAADEAAAGVRIRNMILAIASLLGLVLGAAAAAWLGRAREA